MRVLLTDGRGHAVHDVAHTPGENGQARPQGEPGTWHILVEPEAGFPGHYDVKVSCAKGQSLFEPFFSRRNHS